MVEKAAPTLTKEVGSDAYLTPLGAWAFALGASVGWGSLVITANTYLVQAGPAGSALGMLVGMAVMLIVARNYHYLVGRHSSPGGAYTFARDVFGFDHGVLTAWFLGLTYMAMFWANATSLPLFARFFMGGIFQWGFSYQIFGYQVYLGEALLSIGAILLAGAFCTTGKRGVQRAMICLALTFVVGCVVTFGAAAAGHGASGFSFEPSFVPGTMPVSQVVRIACMSPWAFIGFENISHLSEEFSFPRSRTFRVLVVSLVTVTALYIMIMLLSVMAYPAGYDSWYAYLLDIGNLGGLKGLPAFFAAHSYLGQVGVVILMVTLLALIVSSLIGNIVALSRLLLALARDEVIPFDLTASNAAGVPARCIRLVVLVSLAVPFLGRTAVGWIVDVTTLGATIIYGFVSACALRDARNHGDRFAAGCGLIGLALMVGLGLMLLAPSLTATNAMATESYFLFTVWGIAGFICFHRLLRLDEERRFGKSIVAWLVLLSLILFTSLAWFGQITSSVTSEAMTRVEAYYSGTGVAQDLALSEADFVREVMAMLNGRITGGILLVGGLFMFSLGIMLSNFATMRMREEESERRTAAMRSIAHRDQLTGVKNKRAYAIKEEELNAAIATGEVGEFGVVVCDVNGLKQVNDTLGHKAGDDYIRAASTMVCKLFKHSPVFRVGGDEFVVVLQGQDFERRHEIMEELSELTTAHIEAGEVVVAAGLAEYAAGHDRQVQEVFGRADTIMYQRKRELKALQGLPER